MQNLVAFSLRSHASIFTRVYNLRKRNPNRLLDKCIAFEIGHLSPATMTIRKKFPGTFKVSEFCEMVRIMGWTDNEILAFVRGNESYLFERERCGNEEIECVDSH